MVLGQETYDEIEQFLDARYVPTYEALWRLSQLEIIDKNPPAVCLSVHLENHHAVYFREEQLDQATQPANPGTKITE